MPGAAGAAPLAFEGTLTLDYLAPPLAAPSITGCDVAIASPWGSPSALGTLRLRGGIGGQLTVLVTDPRAFASQVFAVRLSAGLGIGTLAPFQPANPLGPQLTRRTLPVPGLARLCLLNASCDVHVPIPLTEGGTRGLGIGGVIAVSALGGAANVSIESAPWTVGTATLTVPTPQGGTGTAFAFGFVHGPNSFTASTATPNGFVHLVTPMVASGTALPDLSGFGRLSLRFVPEPGPLASLVSGLVGLLVLARTRRSRRGASPCPMRPSGRRDVLSPPCSRSWRSPGGRASPRHRRGPRPGSPGAPR